MKYFVILISLFFFSRHVCSQVISNDGKYVFALNTVKSTFDSWEKEIAGDYNAFFSNDNRLVFNIKDTLSIVKVGTSRILQIPGVQKFQKAVSDDAEYVVYLSGKDKKLYMLDIQSERELSSIDNITDFAISPSENTVLLKQFIGNKTYILCLFLTDSSHKPHFVTSTNLNLKNVVFDASGKQLAFPVSQSNRVSEIWHFKCGMDSAKMLVSDAAMDFSPGLKLSVDKTIFGFTPSGKNFYFLLENIPDTTKPKADMPSVDVWSYNDALIQSQQITWASSFSQEYRPPYLRDYRPRYLAAINLTQIESKVILLQRRNQILCEIFMGYGEPEINNNNVLVFQPEGDLASDYAGEQQGYLLSDYKWSRATKCKVFLVSLNTGQQTLIKETKLSAYRLPLFKFSPNGNYIVFFDASENEYFSYEVSTGKIRNISKLAATSWIKGNPERMHEYFEAKREFLAWTNNDDHLLALDHFGDCWKLDPTGKSKPIILTNYFGKEQHIRFYPYSSVFARPARVDNSMILFKAERGLENGFFSIDSFTGQLKKIIWGEYQNPRLIKAASANVFLLELESVKSSRRWYFYTPQNSRLERLDNINSSQQKPIQKELVHWKTLDGKTGTGLLYKPENFDSAKMYPVIINYYEQEASRNANNYEEYDENVTSITWSAYPPLQYCLTHGYLVFMVDIHYEIGLGGENVYNYVISAAKYLGNKRYVDSTKIGIVGHSFGGWETNYLITRTNIFAAAVSGAGISNLIAQYGNINNDEQGYPFTEGQVRIGATPWDRPDLFIKNSPIFYANKVSIPVLFMANKNDLRVPYSQSIAFFKALRRLGKRCWLLQYDHAEHMLSEKEDAIDFGIRQMQFFDHYLKGAPAPVWMTRGIPASMKGKTLGYEYDSMIKTPGPGLLMENEDAYTPAEKELLKHKTTVNNAGRIVDVIEPKKVKGIQKNK